jgi:hypothetical protein
MSAQAGRRLSDVESCVRATVEALNTVFGRPVSTSAICDALTPQERQTLSVLPNALPRRVARVLNQLVTQGQVARVKDGRMALFYVRDVLSDEACAAAAKPSRRRRVLDLVYATVERLKRAARAVEVVAVGGAIGVTREIPADMIKRDLTNLVRTGELRVISTVRGDGGGNNLYLPSDLDPSTYIVEEPLTWLEELHTAFQAVWAERARAAELSGHKPVPPSTGDVRTHFRVRYPDHEKLSDPQLLVNGMKQLAGSTRPRVRAVRRTGQRALLWVPTDMHDADLDLGGAHASDIERAVEAARRALTALGVPAVRVEEIQDELDRDNRLRPAGRQPLRVVLSDAARTELINSDGSRSPRAVQRLTRVGMVGGSTYYATGDTTGAGEYLDLLWLRIEWTELNATEELDAAQRAALPSIRVGRAIHLAQVCEAIACRAESVSAALPHPAFVEEVVEIHDNASACAAEARGVAAEASVTGLPATVGLAAVGFTPRALLSIIAPRYPLAGEDLTTARLVPLLERQIKRIPNPRFEWRFSTAADTASEYLFDCVSARTYASFRWGDNDERYYANLAATTLGLLRDCRFVTPVLKSERFEERLIGVACLAFLGDPEHRLPNVAARDTVSSVREAAEWGINFVNSTRRVST